jgi:hypothetical protein
MPRGLVAIALVLPLTGCASSVAVDDLSSLSHVHNIVLHDDRVLLGSHEGLFTPSEGADWTRIGDEFDVMALTKVNGELLASGHPGPGFDFPDPVGLLASSDGGETWEARSLVGEVDFHLLEASGSTVIGVAANYGVLLKSTDSGVSWSSLDVPALTDLAIDPADPDTIVLATETGLQRSSDGGLTFALTRTTIKPILLDWSASDLFGATEDSVWRWSDELGEWTLVQDGYDAVHGMATSNGNLAVFDGETVSTIHVKN